MTYQMFTSKMPANRVARTPPPPIPHQTGLSCRTRNKTQTSLLRNISRDWTTFPTQDAYYSQPPANQYCHKIFIPTSPLQPCHTQCSSKVLTVTGNNTQSKLVTFWSAQLTCPATDQSHFATHVRHRDSATATTHTVRFQFATDSQTKHYREAYSPLPTLHRQPGAWCHARADQS
jgi:hypothetical protein